MKQRGTNQITWKYILVMLVKWQCWSVQHFDPDRNVLKAFLWIVMTFYTDIQISQNMNPVDLEVH